jgi:DNA-binding LytR/AlgR family response regulator
MNCIVIDDDKVAQKAIEYQINKTTPLKLLGTYNGINVALEEIKKSEIDIIFLDIEMPGISGIDFLRNFGDLPHIIICSAKREYAAEAFDYNVTDYLVKPVKYERFLKAIDKVTQVQENFTQDKVSDAFFIKKEGRYIKVQASDILYIEALSDYVNIYTNDNRYTICSTMRAIESKLPTNKFLRIHRSYIVQLAKITAVEDNTVCLNDKLLPVSKSHLSSLTSKLNFL